MRGQATECERQLWGLIVNSVTREWYEYECECEYREGDDWPVKGTDCQ